MDIRDPHPLCCGTKAKVLYCSFGVSEFKPYSCYYIHFRTDTFGKDMETPYPPAMAYKVPQMFLYQDDFGI